MSSARVFLGLTVLLSLLSLASAQNSPLSPPQLPFGSVSTSDDIWSLLYNPAGLGFSRDLQAYYLHGYNDSSFDGHKAVFTSLGKSGFSVEWLGIGSQTSYRRYTLAQG